MKWINLLLLMLICISIMIPLAKSDIHYNANTYPFTFPTYGTAMGFSTDMTFDRAYRLNDYWYFNTSTVSTIAFQVQVANLLVTDFFASDPNKLYFTLTATSGTSTTNINVTTRGSPTSVNGASSWIYNSATHILTITRVHASSYAITVIWGGLLGDHTPPIISNVWHQGTVEGTTTSCHASLSDDISLSYFRFSSNVSGVWLNGTWIHWPHPSAGTQTTMNLPSAGTVVGFRWYVNDTSNNWATSLIYTLTVTSAGENIVMLLDLPGDQSTSYTKTVTFNYEPIFFQAIQNASLWTNITGTWQATAWNTTAILNATSNSISYSFTTSGTYLWNVRVYNSTTGVFSTANRTLTVWLEPICTEIGVSPTMQFEQATFYSRWTDGDGLAAYVFSSNLSGFWSNYTWTAFSGSPTETLATELKTLPAEGTLIGYLFYALDVDGFYSKSSTLFFTVTGSFVALAPDFSSWWQWLSEGDMLGFLQAIYIMAFGSVDIFYSLVALLIVGAIYIRTHSLILIGILWLLVGGIAIVALPLSAGVAVFFTILGVASLLFQLFKPNSPSY